jgi:hypothetical protein
MVPDPKIHYDLLRFCRHTRLAFLARSVPPDVLMRPADVNFDPARVDRTSPVPVPVFIQDSMVKAILQRGLGATYVSPCLRMFWHGAARLSNCHIMREASALRLYQLLGWQLITTRLLIWSLGWVRSLTPLMGCWPDS